MVYHDMSLQIFDDARRVVVLFLAPSQLTDIVDLFLRRRADETRRINSKVTLQVHPFNEASLPRRNEDLRSEVHLSRKSRRIRLREEVQPVLYPALQLRRA